MEDEVPGGLQHCHKTCCEKGGCCGRRACRVQRWHHCRDVVFRTGGLVYNIHPVVNISQIVRYKEQVKGQKKEEGKPIEIEGVEEWEIEKILNKRKIRGIDKYLVRWKGFTAEHDTWERKEDLGNVREVLEEFEGRTNAEVRRQEKLDMEEEKDFRRGKLPGKFTAKMLYGWDDGRFEEEYLRKLERNGQRWKAVSPEEKP